MKSGQWWLALVAVILVAAIAIPIVYWLQARPWERVLIQEWLRRKAGLVP